MEELLRYIAVNLVDQPSEVAISKQQKDDSLTVLSLTVAQADMGKVIGKQGKVAKAIRKVVKAAATKQNINCAVDIVG